MAYGNGTATYAKIVQGIMFPVGIPPNQPVLVTLYLASGIPGSPVQVGLYDGGLVNPASALPSPSPVGSLLFNSPTTGPIVLQADQTVRFNFQSGVTLGLYRALVTIASKQYLLQFYATKPRAVPGPIPTLPPITTPPPDRHP